MKDTNGLLANHWLDLTVLGARDIPGSTDASAKFPLRATRDSDLSIDDLRVLICLAVRIGKSDSCIEDTRWIARHTDLPEQIVVERLEQLGSRGYLRRDRSGQETMLSLVPDAGSGRTARAESPVVPASAKRRRGSQARLHGDLLRRRTRRPVGSIEFDDPVQPHPVVASLQEAVEGEPGGVSGFRFWLKTILDPEDVTVFSNWASRQSAEYQRLIRRYDRANDDRSIESLLDATLALVRREKSANR